jgi:histone deacetylase complex regulatory component SIN3
MLPLRSPSFRQFKFVFLPDHWKIRCQYPNPINPIQLTTMNHTFTTPTGTMALVAGPHPGVTTGGDRPLRGGQTPLTGGHCPLSGGQTPLSGGDRSLYGGQTPLSGGVTSPKIA